MAAEVTTMDWNCLLGAMVTTSSPGTDIASNSYRNALAPRRPLS